MIEIFTLLERNKADTLDDLTSRINRERPAYKELAEDSLKALLDKLHESYLDFLVSGEPDALDPVFRPLCRILAVRGSRLSDVFDLPLMMAAVIRPQLVKEFSYLDGTEAIEKLNETLEITDRTAHKAACRLLDIFQDHLKSRIDSHNNYLAQMQKEFGVDLSSFRLEPEEGQ